MSQPTKKLAADNRLDLTQGIRDALDAIARAKHAFIPGVDSYALLELPKLALADAVLEALAAQQAARLDRLPTRGRMTRVVEGSVRGKRRRQA
jgi:hypothetical protein